MTVVLDLTVDLKMSIMWRDFFNQFHPTKWAAYAAWGVASGVYNHLAQGFTKNYFPAPTNTVDLLLLL